MNIHCIKTLSYELNPNSGDAFDYLARVASQEIDPPSSAHACVYTPASIVLHSPLRRVTETLDMNTKTTYIQTDLLKEIPFELQKLCSEDEWKRHRSSIVRKRFKEHFIEDLLPKKRGLIIAEIQELLRTCHTYPEENDLALLSHSFRIKLIEAFIKTSGEIATKPELIHEVLHDDEKTYAFGSGFTITNDGRIENLS